MKGGIIAAGWGERLGGKIPKALTPIGPKVLLDFALDGFVAAGISEVTLIVNEGAREVPAEVARRRKTPALDWIIQTTPSSLHSFLIVLRRLAQSPQSHYLLTTVDSVCPPSTFQTFVKAAHLRSDADVVLGLTSFVEDEKPLRAALRGDPSPSCSPSLPFEVTALGEEAASSPWVTAGFYYVKPGILSAAAEIPEAKALRVFLGHLLRRGCRVAGVPLPPVVDVDRPADIESAKAMVNA